jgi:hypothetical protein
LVQTGHFDHVVTELLGVSLCHISIFHQRPCLWKLDVKQTDSSAVFWSLIFTALALISWKHPGEWFRTAAWVGGLIGYGLVISIYMILTFSSAGHRTGQLIATHDLVAFGLVSVIWVLGVAWGIQAMRLSILAGDWKKTIWAKGRSNRSGTLD